MKYSQYVINPNWVSSSNATDDAILVKIVSCNIICHLVSTSEVRLKLSYAYVFEQKKNENDFDFQTLTIFRTEIGTSVGQKDVQWATNYDNICFHPGL